MSVRPFVLVGAKALARIRGAIAQVAAKWSADWIPGMVIPSVSCRAVADLAPEEDLSAQAWSRLGQAEAQPLWVAGAAPKVLRGWLFGTANGSDGGSDPAVLAEECAVRALDDFLQRLVEVMNLPAAPEGPKGGQEALSELTRAGSGAVLVNVAIGAADLGLLLSGACVAGFLKAESEQTLPMGRLSPVSEGLAAQEVGLKVWLGKVEVTLGMLREISVGDVIRLPTPIDDAMDVSTDDGAVLFKSYLGVKDGHLAIELCGRSSATEK